MKRNVIAALFFLVSLTMASCSKFTNGDPVTERRNVSGRFTTICMYNNVNVNLIRSDHPHLELTCPKNLIEKVTTEVRGDSLVIKNENDFNWLRPYDYDIDLDVYYDSLREITYASIGRLTCNDSLRGYSALSVDTIAIGLDSIGNVIDSIDTHWSRNFVLRIHEGSGDISLCLNCDIMKTVFSFGTSKVDLRGYAGYTEHYLKSYGTVHAENLYSNLVSVSSESTNDIYVWANSKLTVRIYSIGNVYYKGHPWIEKHLHGEGQVIPL